MPWVVGIDEAGYGPNLGPLVQAAVAVRLPDCDPAGWETLKECVRRRCDPADDRLLIDDSKKVYAGANGFALLGHGVLAVHDPRPLTLQQLIEQTVLHPCVNDLCAEAWFRGDDRLVVSDLPPLRERSWFHAARSVIVPAPRFNRLLDEHRSKAVALALGLADLMTSAVAMLPPGEPVVFHCDKMGGRNYYASLLQRAFPDGWVVALKESADESRYRIANLDHDIEIIFRPRSDAASVAVALASMTAKYLREICMIQFNAFWAQHVPGLKPTAGYPGDAKRFFDAIRPAMERVGISQDAVWRKK
jgi:hypothetical protein